MAEQQSQTYHYYLAPAEHRDQPNYRIVAMNPDFGVNRHQGAMFGSIRFASAISAAASLPGQASVRSGHGYSVEGRRFTLGLRKRRGGQHHQRLGGQHNSDQVCSGQAKGARTDATPSEMPLLVLLFVPRSPRPEINRLMVPKAGGCSITDALRIGSAKMVNAERTSNQDIKAIEIELPGFFRQPPTHILGAPAQAGYGDKWPSQ